MPSRRDDTPTSPETSRQLDAIAARLRKRSTQLTAIVGVRALEVLALLDLSLDDPRRDQLERLLRGVCEQAIDAAHSALSQELAEVAAERDRLARRVELMRRSDER